MLLTNRRIPDAVCISAANEEAQQRSQCAWCCSSEWAEPGVQVLQCQRLWDRPWQQWRQLGWQQWRRLGWQQWQQQLHRPGLLVPPSEGEGRLSIYS